MKYGLPYKGSKNQIAQQIVDALPAGDVLVDLFGGGGAITHCAVLSHKWKKVIYNDNNELLVKFFKNAVEGKYKHPYPVYTRQEFNIYKYGDPVAKWCYSFGNDGKYYLWSADVEQFKITASKMIEEPDARQRYSLYRKFINELLKYLTNGDLKNVSLENLYRLQGIERLEGLEGIERIEDSCLDILNKDYREVEIPDNAIVYCDIPYKGTKADYVQGFDYEAFYEWASKQNNIYISEYEMPDNFKCVKEITRRGTLSMDNKTHYVTEKIFTVKG